MRTTKDLDSVLDENESSLQTQQAAAIIHIAYILTDLRDLLGEIKNKLP